MTAPTAVGQFVRHDRDYLINTLQLDPNREAEQELNTNSPMVVVAIEPDPSGGPALVMTRRELTILGPYSAVTLTVIPEPPDNTIIP